MIPHATIHVLGATGRTGARLCRSLIAAGHEVVPVARDPARWRATSLPGTPRRADYGDQPALAASLADAEAVVNASHAVWTRALLQAAPVAARLVLIGTARRYGDLGDPPGRDAAEAETLLLASGRDGAMLHPTMIYGDPNDGTVSRLAALLGRTPILPLPAGGRALVQPIHVDDVVLAIEAALARTWTVPTALPIGGPAAMPYAALVRAVAAALRRRPPPILPIPAWAARRRPALRRLLEDRDVPTAPMRTELGLRPRGLAAGLAQMFE